MTDPHAPSRRNPLLPIFLTVFIDLVGFGILIPIFPLLINDTPFRVTPASWSPRTGLIMLGWLQAVYPLCTFVAAPILGQLSDRFGRRPVLAISIAGTAVGYAIFAIGISTKAIPLLFVGRAIDGFTGGNIAVAQAAIGDVSNDSNRQKNFGLIGAAFGMGFIIGPYLGGQSTTGDYFALVGLSIAFMQAIVVGKLAKHLSDFQILRFSMFGLAIAMSGYLLTTDKWQLYAIIPLFTLFNGLTFANTTSLISRSAIPGRQGEAMGISNSVMNLAQVPASVLVGYITGSVTSKTPLLVACLCIGAGGLIFMLFFRPKYVSTTVGAPSGAPTH